MRFKVAALLLSSWWSTSAGSYVEAQDAVAKTEVPVVKLLEAGASPRVALRLQPKKGDQQISLMTTKMKQSMLMNGVQVPTPGTPPTQFAIEVSISDVSENEIVFDYQYTNVKLLDDEQNPSPNAALIKQQLELLKGVTGTCTLTDRGFITKHDLNFPDEVTEPVRAMLDGMKDSLSRLGSPLPEEPIGIGAKWSVEQNVDANGVKLQQTSIHTLNSIEGSAYTVEIAITQTAMPQKMQLPRLPPGATVELESLDSSGMSTMTLNLANVFPKSELGLRSKMKLKIDVAGQTQKLEAETKMEMTISPELDVHEQSNSSNQ